MIQKIWRFENVLERVMIKKTMKMSSSPRLQGFMSRTGCLKLGLIILVGMFVNVVLAQPVNDNFANATFIAGLSGTTNGDNNLATMEPGEPVSITTDDNSFGVSVGASAWYVWTAPANGNVTFDTIGSSFDTILAVYTGNSVASLTQLTANDDISTSVTNSQTAFYAVANTTYFIAVYGFNAPPITQGNVVLNWTMQTPGFSAGQFRFTSTSYTVSQDESTAARGGTAMNATPLGARVSVTRVGGAVGKVQVAYSITNAPVSNLEQLQVDGANISIINKDSNNVPLSFTNIYITNYLIYPYLFGSTNICIYTNWTTITIATAASTNTIGSFFPISFPTNGFGVVTNPDLTVTTTTTNVFFSLTFTQTMVQGAIPRDPKNPNNVWDYLPANGVLTFNDYEMTKDIFVTVNTNNYFATTPVTVQVNLDSVALDTNELQTIPPPTLDPTRSSASVNILNVWQAGAFSGLCPGTDRYFVTNLVNFERSTLRVKRSAGTARIAVYRGGGAADYSKASTIYYQIDANRAFDDYNTFNLQAGSDYAIPDIATKNAPEGVVDFISPTWGSVTFPANSGGSAVQFINVPINDNSTVEFNKDFLIYFAADNSGHKWTEAIPGNIQTCTVTILYDKEPAGAADRTYNVDHSTGTVPPNNPNPGANGSVFAVAVQPDGKGLVAGDFTAYGTNSTRIARAFTNGQPDIAFIANTGLGADGFIDALALDTNANIFIGGGFSSFNGVQRNGIARINPDGALDTTVFKPGVGANGTVSSILVQPDGQILVAGNFTSFNNAVRNCIVRLNPDGTVDDSFDPLAGPLDDVFPESTGIHSLALQTDGRIIIGGDFTSVDDISRNYIARLNADGSLDTSFDPGAGANDVINAVAVDTNGLILAGGAFTQLGTLGGSQGIARLNADGSVDTTFGVGSGANDIVYSITLQPDGGILLGGLFTSINQTRRVSIARLLPDGTVDTSFMDTAYNQFAGLINPYYNPDINARNPVYATALQADGNILIGGLFAQVGGGFSRADIRPRSNVARLIGGATPGPGNIGLTYNSYSAVANSGTQTNLSYTVTLSRLNGSLGPAAATVQPVTLQSGPGAAVYGVDFLLSATPVIWGTTWSDTWMLSDGVSGPDYGSKVTILNNANANSTLNLQVTQPISQDIFFLGGANKKTSIGLLNSKYTAQDGENIPLGVALGQSLAPLSIIHNNLHPGTLTFTKAIYSTNENSGKAVITVNRTGGSDGSVTVHYKTVDGTAHAGTDYTSTSGTLTFGSGITNQTFNVFISDNVTAQPDRFLSLQLFTPGGNATLGTTNAQLVIIDNDYSAGHVFFDGGIPVLVGTTNLMTYGTNEDLGAARVTVTRQGGSTGQLIVSVASGGGTATNGVNYVGFTNQVTWNNVESGPKTILLPVMADGVVTSNLTVNLRLFGSTVNGSTTAQPLSSVYTNAILTITNLDSTGTVQFSASSYSFNENGGQAIIPVVRTGGSAGSVSVNVGTLDGSAYSNADYFIITNNLLTFTNGEVSKSFRVPIIDNLIQDGNRSLSLVLTNVSPAGSLGSPGVATLNIVDDETYNQPPGTIDSTYNPSAGFNGPIFALALQPSDGKLVVGGSFTFANGVGRRQIARMNVDGTLDAKFSSYLPSQGASDTVRALAVQTDGRIFVGGFFTNFNGSTFNHIARLNYNGSLDSSFNPGSGMDNPVYAVAETFVGGVRKLYVGGAFANVNGTARNAIARLNDNGTLDTSFTPGTGANGTVFALAVQTDGKVLIGGDFTVVNGVTNFNHVGRLNMDGSVDTSFNPAGIGADSPVHSIAVQLDGKILIGGLFTNYNGVPFNHIVRLNINGSIDTGFTPGAGANGDVQTIALQTDTRILLGGSFTKCSGVTRNHITRLNPDGTVDRTINFGLGADGFVAASVLQGDGNIDIGGGFLNYGGVSHPYLARIFGGSMSGSGAIEFSAANYSFHESSVNATITVVRTGGTSGTNADGTGDIIIPFTMGGGTAVAGVNYSNIAVNLHFPAGEVAQTIAIPLLDDTVVTSNLTVNLALGAPTLPSQIGNQPTAVLTIINDDSTVKFSSPTFTVPKNTISGTATIHVTRVGSIAGTSTVTFLTTTNGTAIAGTDYTPTNEIATFNPGQTDVIVPISIINNGLPEGNTTVSLVLTNAVNTILSSPSNAVLTIVDTVNAPGTLSFDATNYFGNEGSPSAILTVLRTAGSSGSVSVSYTTVPDTAQPTVNYTAVTGTLTFGDGETTKTIAVPLVDNNLVQGTMRLAVVLSNPTGGSVLADPTNAVVFISDNDFGVAFVNGTNYVSETNGVGSIFVQRIGDAGTPFTVHYATTNGTALNGTNYSAVSGTMAFASGEVVKAITVPLIYLPEVTGSSSFGIALSNPTANARLVAPSNTVVVIQDGDAGLSFTNATMSVLKNNGFAVITVVCSNPSIEPIIVDSNTVPLSVHYSTIDGTAVSGVDYATTSGTLMFTNGLGTNTFNVPIINNSLVTGTRTFTVKLSNPTAPGKLVAPSNQIVSIVDNNSGLKFSSPVYKVLKTGIGAAITILRTDNTNTISTVNYATADGTAVAGLDYFATNGMAVFTNGETSKTFFLTVIANTTVQPDKTVLLQLSNPTNGILISPYAATLTIHDTSGSLVVPSGSTLVSESLVPANGIIDPGENVSLLFAFRASGGNNVTNLLATLLVTNGVTSPSPSGAQGYGALTVGGPSTSRQFSFIANGTNSQRIAATFKLQDGTNNLGTAAFTFSLGTWTTTFYNTNAIVINDAAIASPYPSSVTVSNLGGVIIKATVTLTNLNHASPADVNALVMSPAGADTVLMSHAGAQHAVKNVTLKFDDAAAAYLSQTNQLVSGTNKPTSYLPVPNFP